MATLAADHHARTDDAPAPALDGRIVTRMAATLLRKGHTTVSVREHAAGRPQFAYMWIAIADAMDAITADAPAPVPAQRPAPACEAAQA